MKRLVPATQADDLDRFAVATVPLRPLAEFAAAAAAVADEATIRVGPDGFTAAAPDPANVAMVEATLPPDNCDALDAPDGSIPVGADVTELAERVRWLADETAQDTLATVEIHGPADEDTDGTALGLYVGVENEATMRVRTVAAKHVREVSGWGGPADATDLLVDGRQLRRGVAACDEGGIHQVLVEYGPGAVRDADRVALRSYGNDDSGDAYPDGRLDYRLYLNGHGLLDVGAGGVVRSGYSVNYLQDLVSAVPDCRPVRLRFDEWYPLTLSFDLAGPEAGRPGADTEVVGDVAGHVEFSQAPRLPPDEYRDGGGPKDGGTA